MSDLKASVASVVGQGPVGVLLIAARDQGEVFHVHVIFNVLVEVAALAKLAKRYPRSCC